MSVFEQPPSRVPTDEERALDANDVAIDPDQKGEIITLLKNDTACTWDIATSKDKPSTRDSIVVSTSSWVYYYNKGNTSAKLKVVFDFSYSKPSGEALNKFNNDHERMQAFFEYVEQQRLGTVRNHFFVKTARASEN